MLTHKKFERNFNEKYFVFAFWTEFLTVSVVIPPSPYIRGSISLLNYRPINKLKYINFHVILKVDMSA